MRLTDVVIVAIVGALGSVLGSLLGILAANKLTNYRLQKLEEKVDKHNNLIDRTYKLERDYAILEQHVADLHRNDE